jgi:hypothetical protein
MSCSGRFGSCRERGYFFPKHAPRLSTTQRFCFEQLDHLQLDLVPDRHGGRSLAGIALIDECDPD